jgi:hypothetical protein
MREQSVPAVRYLQVGEAGSEVVPADGSRAQIGAIQRMDRIDPTPFRSPDMERSRHAALRGAVFALVVAQNTQSSQARIRAIRVFCRASWA